MPTRLPGTLIHPLTGSGDASELFQRRPFASYRRILPRRRINWRDSSVDFDRITRRRRIGVRAWLGGSMSLGEEPATIEPAGDQGRL